MIKYDFFVKMFLVNLYIHSHGELLGLSPFLFEANKYLLILVATPVFIMKQVVYNLRIE